MLYSYIVIQRLKRFWGDVWYNPISILKRSLCCNIKNRLGESCGPVCLWINWEAIAEGQVRGVRNKDLSFDGEMLGFHRDFWSRSHRVLFLFSWIDFGLTSDRYHQLLEVSRGIEGRAYSRGYGLGSRENGGEILIYESPVQGYAPVGEKKGFNLEKGKT